MEALIEFLTDEWVVITDAPLTLLILAVLCVFLGYRLGRQKKNDEAQALRAQAQALGAQISAKNERFDLLNDKFQSAEQARALLDARLSEAEAAVRNLPKDETEPIKMVVEATASATEAFSQLKVAEAEWLKQYRLLEKQRDRNRQPGGVTYLSEEDHQSPKKEK